MSILIFLKENVSLKKSASEPSMFYAQSHLMKNGYCDVMASPVNKKCTSGPFFSNPDRKYPYLFSGEPTGKEDANNARWFQHNRYQLEQLGNEALACPSDYMYDTKILNCFMSSKKVLHQL